MQSSLLFYRRLRSVPGTGNGTARNDFLSHTTIQLTCLPLAMDVMPTSMQVLLNGMEFITSIDVVNCYSGLPGAVAQSYTDHVT